VANFATFLTLPQAPRASVMLTSLLNRDVPATGAPPFAQAYSVRFSPIYEEITMSTTPTAATPATPRRVRRAPQPLPPVSPEAREMISWGAHLMLRALARPEQGTPPLATSVYWALAGISLAMTEDPALGRGLRRLRRVDKETIDLIQALGHAVPGTLRDWVGGPERQPTSGATPPASAGEPATVPTAAETESAVETDLDLLADFPSALAREKMLTRLGVLIEHASTRPDCVERARALADEQADDDAYKLGHFLAEILTEIRSGAYQGVGWPSYQAPPRTRPAAGPQTPAATSSETTRERGQ